MILFFFQPHAAHPNLHSFPTRRSSDLNYMKMRQQIDSSGTGWVSLQAFKNAMAFERAFVAAGGLMAAGVDRKSTGLNSSHGYISYAVFCLKKKKTYLFASRYDIYMRAH